MKALDKAIENRRSPWEIGAKEKVISLRVSGKMEEALEAQAQEWTMSLSDAVRRIISFYFLPIIAMENMDKEVDQLVDPDEAEEYANFLIELNQRNMEHYQAMRDEAIAMAQIAAMKLYKQAKALEDATLPDFGDLDHGHG